MSDIFTPIYTTYQSVKVRLAGKVQFQSDGCEALDGEIPNELLGQQIVDAETAVEQELRGRYAIPFQSISKGTFASLPDHSKRVIRILADLKAVMNILGTDFGSGTHVTADPYYKDTEKRYKLELKRALGQDAESEDSEQKRYRKSPPLDDMKLANSNSKADDGYKGMLINTDRCSDSATYAEGQINNPSIGYLNSLGLRTRRRS